MNSSHDLDTWRLFFLVVNLGSITKAAETTKQEPSAISRKINKLEKDLGTDLFIKEGRQLKLNSAGHLAFSRMRRIVLDARSLLDDLSNSKEQPQKLISIAAPIGISEKILPLIMTEYVKIAPETRFSCRAMSYVELFSTETFQGYDIVLSMSPLTSATTTSMLLGGIKHVLMASTEFITSLKTPLTHPSQLNQYPLFSFYSRNRERSIYLRDSVETYHLNLDACCRFNHPGAIKTAVMSNNGIGVYCPYYFYTDEIENKIIEQVLPNWRLPLQPVYLNKKLLQRDHVNNFIDWFCERFISFKGVLSPLSNGFWMSDFNGAVVNL